MKKLCLFLCICLLANAVLIAQETINTHDQNGKTPLLLAISENNLTKVFTLVKNGANVQLAETKSLQGTPLMYASSVGNLKICELLLKKGANVNAVDMNNDHALNWATYAGNIAVIKLLLQNDADIFQKSKHGTAVDVALRLWHHDSVVRVFDTTKIAESLSKNEKKLVTAVLENNYNSAEKALKKATANTKDELKTPVLQLAAQQGNYELTKLLLEKGANVNSKNRVGQTSLAWAARFGHVAIVDLLLQNGANVNASGKTYQLTPLMAAAVNGNTTIGKLLLDHQAEIDTQDVINTASALHWAIWYKNEAFAEMLLHRGADYTVKSVDDTYSAYDVAKIYNLEKVVQFIENDRKTQNSLKGSWKVQEIHYMYADTTYIQKEEKYGRFLFTDTKYMLMYNPYMQKRTPFQTLSNPTAAEISKAFQTIVFNSGSYILKENIITTTADIAKVPGFEGGQQWYRVRRKNDILELIFFDETYPNGNKPTWYGKLKIKFILKKEHE